MKLLSARHEFHFLGLLVIVSVCLTHINASSPIAREDDADIVYPVSQKIITILPEMIKKITLTKVLRRSGVSMLRLRKSDPEYPPQEFKRAMSMMRLRRQGPDSSWARQIRGPSMMRLKRLPPLIKDMNICDEYPQLC